MFYSAGGNYINVWDILAGGKLHHQFSNHQKTITSLCFNGDYTRLLSGSLDRCYDIFIRCNFLGGWGGVMFNVLVAKVLLMCLCH